VRNVFAVAPAPPSATAGTESRGGRGAGASHRTSVVESGAFASARCSCGWQGPARRARSGARQDAREHTGG
jgi:hypothetical protein